MRRAGAFATGGRAGPRRAAAVRLLLVVAALSASLAAGLAPAEFADARDATRPRYGAMDSDAQHADGFTTDDAVGSDARRSDETKARCHARLEEGWGMVYVSDAVPPSQAVRCANLRRAGGRRLTEADLDCFPSAAAIGLLGGRETALEVLKYYGTERIPLLDGREVEIDVCREPLDTRPGAARRVEHYHLYLRVRRLREDLPPPKPRYDGSRKHWGEL